MAYHFSKTIIKHDGCGEWKYKKHTKRYTLYDGKKQVGNLNYGPTEAWHPLSGGINLLFERIIS